MKAGPRMAVACRAASAATPTPERVAACRQAVLQQTVMPQVVLVPVPQVVPTPADLRWAAVPPAADLRQAPAVARATPLPAALPAQAVPAQAAKAANVRVTLHQTPAVLHAPAQNMFVHRTRPHRVLLQLASTAAAEATAQAVPTIEAAHPTAAVTTEAVHLREVPLQVRAAVQAAATVEEAAVRVQVQAAAAAVQAAVAAIAPQAVAAARVEEEDNFRATTID